VRWLRRYGHGCTGTDRDHMARNGTGWSQGWTWLRQASVVAGELRDLLRSFPDSDAVITAIVLDLDHRSFSSLTRLSSRHCLLHRATSGPHCSISTCAYGILIFCHDLPVSNNLNRETLPSPVQLFIFFQRFFCPLLFTLYDRP
jgi:hypothetical protein